MGRRLNLLEASWLALDDADTPMHVGALLIFRRPSRADAGYVAQLATRLKSTLPAWTPWTLKLEQGGPVVLGAFGARWAETDAIDLGHHLRHVALDAPGGERELGVMVSHLHSQRLDLDRPPWECHLIDGLHHGQFALYCKMHHALMDAASFVRLLTSSLAEGPGAAPVPAWGVAGSSARAATGDPAAEVLASLNDRARLLGTVREIGGAFGRLLRAATGSNQDLRVPYSAPRSVLNSRIGPQRRFATQQYAQSRLESAADACGVTLDELVLYLCGSALRRFFKEYNALPERPLLAVLPAQRAGADHIHGAMGFASLGTHRADPNRRLAEIRSSVRASAEHLRALPETLLQTYAVAAAAPYLLGQLSGLTQLVPPLFNLVVSHLEGPARKLYLGDAELAALYPMFPLTQGSALAIGVISYAGTLNVGFSGAAETLPAMQRMAVYMGLALASLEEKIAAGEIHD